MAETETLQLPGSGNGQGWSPQQALPHSEETERAVLAVALHFPSHLAQLRDLVTAEMFYLDRHARLWEAIQELAATGTAVDLITLQEKLTERGDFEACGGMAYLAGLSLELPDATAWRTYVDIVRERYRRRLSVKLFSSLTVEASSLGRDLDEILSNARRGLEDVARYAPPVATAGGMEKILRDALPPEEGADPPGLPFFVPELNRYDLMGPGLTIVAGRPGHCKSMLVLKISDHVAHTLGRRVLFFSLEMTGEEVARRLFIMRSEGRIEADRYRRGELSPNERTEVNFTFESVRDASRWILHPLMNHTADSIVAAIRHAHAEEEVSLVVVDYIGRLQGLGKTSSEINIGLGRASSAFHGIGLELGLPVLGLHQLNREILKRHHFSPNLGDLRDSGNLEQDAARVAFVVRPWKAAKDKLAPGESPDPEEVSPRELWVHVRKSRDADGDGDVQLIFEAETYQIRGVDRFHTPSDGGWTS